MVGAAPSSAVMHQLQHAGLTLGRGWLCWSRRQVGTPQGHHRWVPCPLSVVHVVCIYAWGQPSMLGALPHTSHPCWKMYEPGAIHVGHLTPQSQGSAGIKMRRRKNALADTGEEP